VIGSPLVQRDGRRTRFTSAGETLVTEARQILEAHDRALSRFAVARTPQMTVGVTEHASDLILPPVIATLGDLCPELTVQFRFDRTRRLNDSLDQGAIDIAVFAGRGPGRPPVLVALIELTGGSPRSLSVASGRAGLKSGRGLPIEWLSCTGKPVVRRGRKA
jgi:DNA-binding transcriptional LysR family regulator